MSIKWSGPAQAGLREITAFYRRIDPEISARMRQRIAARVRVLPTSWKLGSPVAGGPMRKMRVPGEPIVLYYFATSRTILIHDVVHDRQDRPKR